MRSRWMFRRAAIASAAALSVLLRAGAAFAQYPGGQETPPDVAGEEFFRGGDRIPRTGWDFLMFILIALLILLVGLALHYVSRRTTPRED